MHSCVLHCSLNRLIYLKGYTFYQPVRFLKFGVFYHLNDYLLLVIVLLSSDSQASYGKEESDECLIIYFNSDA